MLEVLRANLEREGEARCQRRVTQHARAVGDGAIDLGVCLCVIRQAAGTAAGITTAGFLDRRAVLDLRVRPGDGLEHRSYRTPVQAGLVDRHLTLRGDVLLGNEAYFAARVPGLADTNDAPIGQLHESVETDFAHPLGVRSLFCKDAIAVLISLCIAHASHEAQVDGHVAPGLNGATLAEGFDALGESSVAGPVIVISNLSTQPILTVPTDPTGHRQLRGSRQVSQRRFCALVRDFGGALEGGAAPALRVEVAEANRVLRRVPGHGNGLQPEVPGDYALRTLPRPDWRRALCDQRGLQHKPVYRDVNGEGLTRVSHRTERELHAILWMVSQVVDAAELQKAGQVIWTACVVIDEIVLAASVEDDQHALGTCLVTVVLHLCP